MALIHLVEHSMRQQWITPNCDNTTHNLLCRSVQAWPAVLRRDKSDGRGDKFYVSKIRYQPQKCSWVEHKLLCHISKSFDKMSEHLRKSPDAEHKLVDRGRQNNVLLSNHNYKDSQLQYIETWQSLFGMHVFKETQGKTTEGYWIICAQITGALVKEVCKYSCRGLQSKQWQHRQNTGTV